MAAGASKRKFIAGGGIVVGTLEVWYGKYHPGIDCCKG